MNFRGSIARPVLSPVNASAHPLRHAPHDSRSAWFATPSLCDSFIHYAMPVSRRFRLFSRAPSGASTTVRAMTRQMTIPSGCLEEGTHRFRSSLRPSASARRPTCFKLFSSRCRSSGETSANTLRMAAACFRKIGTISCLPFAVSATRRTRRSSALSKRLTSPFRCKRSTATLIDPE